MTIDANTGAHWRPYHGGALMASAQPERAAEPVWPVPEDPGFTDLVLRGADGVGRLSPFWNQLVPCLSEDQIQVTAGQSTVKPDHKPLIGPPRETVGLWHNTGYSGHGIMGSPSGGRLLADLMTGRLTSEADLFQPDRCAAGSRPPVVEQIVV